MKKFTKIIVCLLLCVFSLGFVACDDDERTPEEKAFTYPNSSDAVYGNGGLAVQKGNYLYYVNGYKTVDSEAHTQDATYTHGALMLMKLNNDGSVATNEDGLIKDDYYITMSDRLCGFNATSLYIAGDYLYFTSPSKENTTENSVDPVWAKDYVEFYRIKLDKSGEVEKIYQADVLYSNLEFEYYSSNNNVFILIYEKGETLEKDSDKNNALVRVTGNGDYSLVANEVSNYIFAENANEIFYIKNEDKEYKMYQYDIVNNNSNLYKTETSNFTIDFVSAGKVYRTFNGHLQASKISICSDFENVCYTTSTYSKVIVDEGVVIAIWDKSINLFGEDLKINRTYTDTATINVIGCVNGSVVYYVDGDDGAKIIKSFSYSNFLLNSDEEAKVLGTVKNLDTTYFDLQDDYVYFYSTVGSNPYLHRVKVANNTEDVVEMVGVYLEDDMPKTEEEEVVEE